MTGVTPIPEWTQDAFCAQTGIDDEIWFPDQGGSANRARYLCGRCPVRQTCLDYCLTHEHPGARHGVWAGTTPKQRQRIVRQQAEGAAA